MGDDGICKGFAWGAGVTKTDETGGIVVVSLAGHRVGDDVAKFLVETLNELGLLIFVEEAGVLFEGREQMILGMHQVIEEAVVPLLGGIYFGEGAGGRVAEVTFLEELGEKCWPFFSGDALLEMAIVFHRVVVLDEEELKLRDDGRGVALAFEDDELGALPIKSVITFVGT